MQFRVSDIRAAILMCKVSQMSVTAVASAGCQIDKLSKSAGHLSVDLFLNLALSLYTDANLRLGFSLLFFLFSS